MSKASEAGNAAVNSVLQICALYGVPAFRMQSRAFEVIGKGGAARPMFVGEWHDALGVKHRSGMADVLATPTIRLLTLDPGLVQVPLWIECKAGSGQLTPEQQAFKSFILGTGGYYLEARDSFDVVLEWFRTHGVRR